MSAITTIKIKHKRLDINSIYERFTNSSKRQVKADKKFLENAILQMINNGIIVNKKPRNGYELFYGNFSNDDGNSNYSQQHL